MGERIGVIGLGRMGRAIAARMAAQGHEVACWTRSGPEAAAALGLPAAESPAALAETSDVLILSLFDDAAVREVIEALLAADLDGKLIVDTSTVSPELLRSYSERFAAAGTRAVDAPISGGPELVEAGTCGVFIGGAPEDAAQAEAVLSAISNRIFHVGPAGAGMGMKIANNAMLLGYWGTLSEVVQIARRSGLDLETALRIIAGGPAGMPMLQARVPKVLGEDTEVGFTLSGVVKDSKVFVGAAEDLDVEIPVLRQAQARVLRALDEGLGEADIAALVRRAWDAA